MSNVSYGTQVSPEGLMNTTAQAAPQAPPYNERIGSRDGEFSKAQGHWLLARMGKKVLRPGGLALTKLMLEALQVQSSDDVAEFAPGLGSTASLTLAHDPRSYTGIDSDPAAVVQLNERLGGPHRRFIQGNAARTDLPQGSMDKVYGEAMLTMHADHRKREIIREAGRILRPGGSYAIHELGLMPDTMAPELKARIQRDLAEVIHVNARPLTGVEWQDLLAQEGFIVLRVETSPMRLLEPGRMIADEGVFRSLRIAYNLLRNPIALKRVLAMRNVFRRHRHAMNAIAIVAMKA